MTTHQTELRLHVPEPTARPGEEPDFSSLAVPNVDETPKPGIDIPAFDTYPLATGMVRVMANSPVDPPSAAVAKTSPWDPELSTADKLAGYRNMMVTRIIEEQFLMLQRQGKAAFAVRSLGEEAVAVSAAMAVDASTHGYGPGKDMHFPTYRQAGILVANRHSLVEMTCQMLSNTGDRLKGAQLPGLHSVTEAGFFSVSGNLGTQMIQAVGWGMASAIEGKRNVAVAWTGEGATAENDFHSAMVFASVYQPPAILNVVNNQWAISSFQGIAGGMNSPFAQRGIGYGIATLRVDGNDFLAGYAATQWATERARAGYGPTLIEWVTYRAASHSSSDDPSRYRPKNAADSWPLGDPVQRLADHMLATGEVSQAELDQIRAEAESTVEAAVTEAEEMGTIKDGINTPPREMFQHVYATPPPHLVEQAASCGEDLLADLNTGGHDH